ncbi:Glutathione transport system permease protein GsiD [bacterium HR23]|nr:Glutathione transport system permease protein GsiD [bacterium HR23]
MATTPRSASTERVGLVRKGQGFWKTLLLSARRKPLGTAGAVILLLVVASAVFAPYITPHDPNAITTARLRPPSAEHWLGTDHLGRDVFARVIYGGRISLLVGFLSTILGTGAGAVLALISAYWGGVWDNGVQRFMDILWAFPSLIIALVIVTVLGSSTRNVILAIAIVVVPLAARVVRSQVLIVKEMEYVKAAQALGASTWRILFFHVAPNCVAPYIIVATATLGGAIVTEASLSFLGMGIPPPTPSWGRDLFGTAANYAELAPWIPIAPGVALSLAVYGFNLLGDAVRDLLDPRLRGR